MNCEDVSLTSSSVLSSRCCYVEDGQQSSARRVAIGREFIALKRVDGDCVVEVKWSALREVVGGSTSDYQAHVFVKATAFPLLPIARIPLLPLGHVDEEGHDSFRMSMPGKVMGPFSVTFVVSDLDVLRTRSNLPKFHPDVVLRLKGTFSSVMSALRYLAVKPSVTHTSPEGHVTIEGRVLMATRSVRQLFEATIIPTTGTDLDSCRCTFRCVATAENKSKFNVVIAGLAPLEC